MKPNFAQANREVSNQSFLTDPELDFKIPESESRCMLTLEDISEQENLLQRHRQTLSHYLYQRASLGAANIPPGVAHGIVEARAYIRYIKQTLRNGGVSVDDHPNDDEQVDLEIGILIAPRKFADGDFALYIWERLEPLLQDAFSIACNVAHEKGRNIIKTKDLFAAIARLQPEPLSELLSFFPPGTLPKPVDEQISTEPRILRTNPQFSGCVTDSLVHLSQQATPQNRLSSAEVFVDIAKYGTGNSVARLRQHGITPETIDTAVEQLGWHIRTR